MVRSRGIQLIKTLPGGLFFLAGSVGGRFRQHEDMRRLSEFSHRPQSGDANGRVFAAAGFLDQPQNSRISPIPQRFQNQRLRFRRQGVQGIDNGGNRLVSGRVPKQRGRFGMQIRRRRLQDFDESRAALVGLRCDESPQRRNSMNAALGGIRENILINRSRFDRVSLSQKRLCTAKQTVRCQ